MGVALLIPWRTRRCLSWVRPRYRRVFTVESMFSHEDHASKLAFAFLGERLIEHRFDLIDCQYQKEHFTRFGAVTIGRDEYRRRLARGLVDPPPFVPRPSAS